MNLLKNKLTALILAVVLIGLLGGCDPYKLSEDEIYIKSLRVGQAFNPQSEIVVIKETTPNYTKYCAHVNGRLNRYYYITTDMQNKILAIWSK